jgi:site-specific DNA recombinase
MWRTWSSNRSGKAIDRLLTAYQEELLSLDELRRRMPELRQREHALQTELSSILDQISDRAVFLRLAETLSSFLTRLRSSADTLDIQERQRIVRLVVRDILVGDETIVIRHSIPLSSMTPSGDGAVQSKFAAPPAPDGRSYLLRSGGGDGPSAKSLPLEPAAKALSNQRSARCRQSSTRNSCKRSLTGDDQEAQRIKLPMSQAVCP